MAPFEIRPATASDIPRLIALDHSCTSDYVWQLELRREAGQVTASFREVRLPRSIEVKYPRNPSTLADEWMRRDVASGRPWRMEPDRLYVRDRGIRLRRSPG